MSRFRALGAPACKNGFTLLETLVALVIVGLVLGGLYQAVSSQVDARGRLNERFLGQTTSWNRLLEQYQVVQGWTPRGNQLGERSGQVEQYGRDWYWSLTTEATFGDSFYRYEVQTFDEPIDQDSVSIVSLVAFFVVQ